jgi:hypothetical protein
LGFKVLVVLRSLREGDGRGCAWHVGDDGRWGVI